MISHRSSSRLSATRRSGPALACAFGALLAPVSASANVTAPFVVAGPDRTIAEFGGTALASDGTGGAIWRQAGDTGSHIYVARYASGRWLSTQRVDTAAPYDSFEPRLVASPGGQLVAVWMQDYAHRGDKRLFRLQSSVLKPGASTFETPVTIDAGLGSDSTETLDPFIQMNDNGVAYLTYRVTTDPDPKDSFPKGLGRIKAAYRVARFNGGAWSGMGPINRNLDNYTVPGAKPGNGPQVSVDQLGNGVVAWVEPGKDLYDRVFARRLFGTRPGFVIPASPQRIGEVPLNGDADAFALAGGGFGAAAVVTLQQPGRPSPLPGARLFLSKLANAEQDSAKEFETPIQLADPSGLYSVPAVSMDGRENIALAYGASSQAWAASVSRTGIGPADAINDGAVLGAPLITNGPSGAGVVAWPGKREGSFGVGLRQTLPGNEVKRAFLAAPRGGNVRDVSVGGSRLGDALVGFLQGEGDDTSLTVAAVQVPPQPFLVSPPGDWVQPTAAMINWDRSASGVGGVHYDVFVDGDPQARGLVTPGFQVPARGLDDGEHEIRVRATDAAGQSAMSAPAVLNVDRTAPTATVVVAKRRKITIRVADPLNGVATAQGSGVDPESVSIRFGDGKRASAVASATHRFKRKGRYLVRVSATDAVGNRGTTVVRLRIR